MNWVFKAPHVEGLTRDKANGEIISTNGIKTFIRIIKINADKPC
jgi:hypothetical protein